MPDALPMWIFLKHPLQVAGFDGAPLEQRIVAEWLGECPFCGQSECLAGFVPFVRGRQRGLEVRVGDGVIVRQSDRREADLLCIVTRVDGPVLLAQAVLVGGTLLERRLGEERRLPRHGVTLAESFALHPAPVCDGWGGQDADDLIASIRRAMQSPN